jgi:hypothetical protein
MWSSLLLAGIARAAPCCVLPGTATPGVLTTGERLGLAVGASSSAWLGDWTREGAFLGPRGNTWYRSNVEARALTRLGASAQLDTGARLLHEAITLDGTRTEFLGLESIDAGLRWDVGSDATRTRPVVLAAARRVGRRDATWEGQLGASLEGTRQRGPWSASATVARGPDLTRAQARAAVGWTLTRVLDVHLGASLAWEVRGSSAGVTPTLTVAAPWRRDGVRVIPVASLAPPVTGAGRAAPAWVSAGVSILAAR